MTKFVLHVVTALDEEMIQRCVLCGEVISDYSNSVWPKDQIAPQGYAPGVVYVSEGSFPKIITKYLPEENIMHTDGFRKCTIK